MGELGKLIPELFYDIFGRIIPGLVALALWSYAFNFDIAQSVFFFSQGFSALQGSTLFLGLGLLTVAYAIGHLVSPISAWSHSKLLPAISPSNFSVLKEAASKGKNAYPGRIALFFLAETTALFGNADREPSAAEYRRITFLWYDWIRLRDPSAGTRLAKMRAEYRMLEGLYVVFGVTALFALMASIFKLIGWTVEPPSMRFDMACVTCFLVAAWAASRLFRTYQFSVINHYYQLRSAEQAEEK